MAPSLGGQIGDLSLNPLHNGELFADMVDQDFPGCGQPNATDETSKNKNASFLLHHQDSAVECCRCDCKRFRCLSDRTEFRSKVEILAERVGLPIEVLDRSPHQLSSGHNARVGIARAIAVDPLLLVLDEPSSALDVTVQAVVRQLLDRLKHEFSMSYIFVSHDLNVVRMLCERVIVMDRGQIVDAGLAEDVFRCPSDHYTQRLIEAIPHLKPAGAVRSKACLQSQST